MEVKTMLKRIISLALALYVPMLVLSSCFDGEPSPAPESSSNALESTAETAPEEPVLRSFYARAVGHYHDYMCYEPEKDTEEFKRWGRIYVDPIANSDTMIYYEEGEVYEIFYSGEIEQMPDSEYGFIKELHSFRIKSSPREYGGIDYEVAIMREAFAVKQFKEDTGSNIVLAKSRHELSEMIDRYFLSQREIPDDATELQKETLTQVNNRKQLIDGYDEEFFEQYDLLMISITASSGSLRFDVTDIVIESGICTVTYEITSKPITDDMAYWMIFVAIPKEVSASVTEYKTFMPKPDWYP